MKLTENSSWPPAEYRSVLDPVTEWATWYEGNPDKLATLYNRIQSVRPSQQASGVVGKISRWFWGQPVPSGQAKARTHVPIARDIARVSARLLFGEQITIKAPDGAEDAALERLQVVLDGNRGDQMFVEAAEFCAAMGGVWFRIGWDSSVAQHPLISVVQPDAAFGTWRYGRLTEVTFVQVVKVEGQSVWRHFETHRVGEITHTLYQGTQTSVGILVPLTESDHTADLPVDGDRIATDVDVLTAVYVPNVRPVPRWRNDAQGQALGASDFDGLEGSFDELDEAWTNLRREGRLDKSRIIAAEAMLENLGPGAGAMFDADREVFTPVKVPGDQTSMPITLAPSTMSVADRLLEIEALTRRIYSDAGYSPETFGMASDGAAVTATEVTARERKSMTTREAKTRTWTTSLEDLFEAVTAVDQKLFSGARFRPVIEFAASVSPTITEVAQAVQALNAGQAASIETKVRMVHPDWDDVKIGGEVALIIAENAMTTPTISIDPNMDPNHVDPAQGDTSGGGLT